MGESEERYIKTKDGKGSTDVGYISTRTLIHQKNTLTLLYCKGGPQGALGQGWSYRWNYQMMAANGYIVVAPNVEAIPGSDRTGESRSQAIMEVKICRTISTQ